MLAVPASNIAIALFKYGNNNALTMKPARSTTCTASFAQALTNSLAKAIVSSLAVIGRTTSTSGISAAGLKKWMPQTLSGRFVDFAISMTGKVLVFVDNTQEGFTILSS